MVPARRLAPFVAAIFAFATPVLPDLRAQDAVTREVVVPLHDGRVALDELLGAVLEDLDLDPTTLELPKRTIDLRGLRGRLVLLATRKALLDSVRFRRALDDDRLIVTIDRARARELRRDARARVTALLGQIRGEDLLERRYELALPEVDDTARPLVVLVHGVESSPAVWDDLREFLATTPSPPRIATFAYPNDGACDAAATALAERLRALDTSERVVLVGHSMGGLIARAVVEDAALDPGNVVMLIQIGTPNQGSNVAAGRFALELADLVRGTDGPLAAALLDGFFEHLVDGLGEAGGDLLPGSVFLTRLARLERNPHVVYRQILGTRSLLRPERWQTVREVLAAQLDDHRATRLLRPRLTAWLDDLDELVDGRGDGAVSVARGRLPDVDPELVPLDHVGLVRLRGLLGAVDDPAAHPVFVRVAAWIRDASVSRRVGNSSSSAISSVRKIRRAVPFATPLHETSPGSSPDPVPMEIARTDSARSSDDRPRHHAPDPRRRPRRAAVARSVGPDSRHGRRVGRDDRR